MAIIKGKNLAGILSDVEFKELGLNTITDFELVKAKPGIWVLLEQTQNVQEIKTVVPIDETEQKILLLLQTKGLNERVEEVFEKSLAKEELEKFQQMLKQGKIIKFKLNPSYKKAVYKLPEDLSKRRTETKKELVDKQNIEDYSLEKNGFLVVKNEERARKLSEQLSMRIKSGEIKGTKSFDGSFYIIETGLLEQLKEKVCSVLAEKKNITVQEIAVILKIGNEPVKIACEFLKEDGALFEKKKGTMCYIE